MLFWHSFYKLFLFLKKKRIYLFWNQIRILIAILRYMNKEKRVLFKNKSGRDYIFIKSMRIYWLIDWWKNLLLELKSLKWEKQFQSDFGRNI